MDLWEMLVNMKIAKTDVAEKESAIKDNAFALMDFLGKIVAVKPALEIALEMENAEVVYVCAMKDILENSVKRRNVLKTVMEMECACQVNVFV